MMDYPYVITTDAQSLVVESCSRTPKPLTGILKTAWSGRRSTMETVPLDSTLTSSQTGPLDSTLTSGQTGPLDSTLTSGQTGPLDSTLTSGQTGPLDSTLTSGQTGPLDSTLTSGQRQSFLPGKAVRIHDTVTVFVFGRQRVFDRFPITTAGGHLLGMEHTHFAQFMHPTGLRIEVLMRTLDDTFKTQWKCLHPRVRSNMLEDTPCVAEQEADILERELKIIAMSRREYGCRCKEHCQADECPCVMARMPCNSTSGHGGECQGQHRDCGNAFKHRLKDKKAAKKHVKKLVAQSRRRQALKCLQSFLCCSTSICRSD